MHPLKSSNSIPRARTERASLPIVAAQTPPQKPDRPRQTPVAPPKNEGTSRRPAPLTRNLGALLSAAGVETLNQPWAQDLVCGLARGAFRLSSAVEFGTPWGRELGALRRIDWAQRIERARDPETQTPKYADTFIHGIRGNNLEQALEQHLSMSVMARRFGHEPGLDDVRLPALRTFGPELPSRPLILDSACGTGDSARALLSWRPDARIIATDLSPEMIAVGRHRYPADQFPSIEFLHRAAEDTRLPANSVDMVSISALFHELPRGVSFRVFQESWRVLKPGGSIFILDQDPASPIIRAQLDAGALTKLIEPYLHSYVTMDIARDLSRIGFLDVAKQKHREDGTMAIWTGQKPLAEVEGAPGPKPRAPSSRPTS